MTIRGIIVVVAVVLLTTSCSTGGGDNGTQPSIPRHLVFVYTQASFVGKIGQPIQLNYFAEDTGRTLQVALQNMGRNSAGERVFKSAPLPGFDTGILDLGVTDCSEMKDSDNERAFPPDCGVRETLAITVRMFEGETLISAAVGEPEDRNEKFDVIYFMVTPNSVKVLPPNSE